MLLLVRHLVSLITVFLLIGGNKAQTSPPSQDAQIVLSCKNYSDTDPLPVATRLILSPNSTQSIKIIDVPKTFTFVVVQAHSFIHSVAMSYTVDLNPQSFVEGTNVGLVLENNATKVPEVFLENMNPYNVSALVSVVPYTKSVPIPGGCNMEFSTSIAPYLRVTQDMYAVTVDGQPARFPQSSDYGDVCSGPDISYRMYHMFMTEHDFSEDSYFTALESMITPMGAEMNGRQIFNSPSLPILRHVYAAYEGVGSVFGLVAVVGEGNRSAYIPTMTYGCDDLSTCESSRFTRIVAGFLVLIGLCLCFATQFLYRLEVLILDTVLVVTVVYIFAVANLVIITGGVVFWPIFVALIIVPHCFKCSFPSCFMIIPLLLFGSLVTSALFFAVTDFFIVLENDTFFWLLFLCIVLLVILMAVTVFTLKFSNIIATSVVGGFLVALGLDLLSGTSLRHIVLNPIYRAAVDNFNLAKTSPPFQTPDFILIFAWIVIAGCGIAVKKVTMRDGSYREVPSGETQPLLG